MTNFDYFETKDLDNMTVAERYYTVEIMLTAMKAGQNLSLDVAYQIAKNVVLERG